VKLWPEDFGAFCLVALTGFWGRGRGLGILDESGVRVVEERVIRVDMVVVARD